MIDYSKKETNAEDFSNIDDELEEVVTSNNQSAYLAAAQSVLRPTGPAPQVEDFDYDEEPQAEPSKPQLIQDASVQSQSKPQERAPLITRPSVLQSDKTEPKSYAHVPVALRQLLESPHTLLDENGITEEGKKYCSSLFGNGGPILKFSELFTPVEEIIPRAAAPPQGSHTSLLLVQF